MATIAPGKPRPRPRPRPQQSKPKTLKQIMKEQARKEEEEDDNHSYASISGAPLSPPQANSIPQQKPGFVDDEIPAEILWESLAMAEKEQVSLPPSHPPQGAPKKKEDDEQSAAMPMPIPSSAPQKEEKMNDDYLIALALQETFNEEVSFPFFFSFARGTPPKFLSSLPRNRTVQYTRMMTLLSLAYSTKQNPAQNTTYSNEQFKTDKGRKRRMVIPIRKRKRENVGRKENEREKEK